MIANGRALHYSGEDHGRAKITSSDAIAIRDAAQQGAPQREIARRYGLGKTTVGHIIARHTWRFA